jgi:4-carboxymuconolactone decarboxylase
MARLVGARQLVTRRTVSTERHPQQARPVAATARPPEHYGRAMSRLPYLRYDDLDPDGQQVWDGVVGSRGSELVNEQGGLVGPFNAFVHAPGVGRRLSSLGGRLRFETSIDRRLSELAIITVGARWKAEFEWWAHARMAREHGVPDAVVDAIGRGEDPPFDAEDERRIYAVASQLTATGQLDQDAYGAAQQLLGDAGLVELVSLCGYYTLISYLLNAFAVPLPTGGTPTWGTSRP